MRFYWFVLGMLAVWRVTHLLNAEDGPWDLFAKLRRYVGGALGGVLDCFYCLSLWIAAPLAYLLGEGWGERLLLWPALSGGAILLERWTSREEPPAPAIYVEDKEADDVLRKEPSAVSRNEAPPPAA